MILAVGSIVALTLVFLVMFSIMSCHTFAFISKENLPIACKR